MSIDDRFAEFHRINPHVYASLKSNALRWKARGARRIGVKALYEFTRITHWLDTTGAGPWRLNNDYTSRYARMLAAESELVGLIELRSLKGGEVNVEDSHIDPTDLDQELYC